MEKITLENLELSLFLVRYRSVKHRHQIWAQTGDSDFREKYFPHQLESENMKNSKRLLKSDAKILYNWQSQNTMQKEFSIEVASWFFNRHYNNGTEKFKIFFFNFRRKSSKSSKPYFSDSLIDRGTESENRMEKDIVSEE